MAIEKYLEKSERVFLDEGFKEFSMDWLATKIGTTKRTLYNNFESREDLFISMIDLRKEKVKNYILPKFSTYGYNAIDIFKEWIIYLENTIKNFGKVFIPTLKEKFPNYRIYVTSSLQQHCREVLSLLIPRGRDEGLLLRSFNIDSYAQFVYSELIGYANSPQRYIQSEELIEFLVRAISTEQGLKHLNTQY